MLLVKTRYPGQINTAIEGILLQVNSKAPAITLNYCNGVFEILANKEKANIPCNVYFDPKNNICMESTDQKTINAVYEILNGAGNNALKKFSVDNLDLAKCPNIDWNKIFNCIKINNFEKGTFLDRVKKVFTCSGLFEYDSQKKYKNVVMYDGQYSFITNNALIIAVKENYTNGKKILKIGKQDFEMGRIPDAKKFIASTQKNTLKNVIKINTIDTTRNFLKISDNTYLNCNFLKAIFKFLGVKTINVLFNKGFSDYVKIENNEYQIIISKVNPEYIQKQEPEKVLNASYKAKEINKMEKKATPAPVEKAPEKKQEKKAAKKAAPEKVKKAPEKVEKAPEKKQEKKAAPAPVKKTEKKQTKKTPEKAAPKKAKEKQEKAAPVVDAKTKKAQAAIIKAIKKFDPKIKIEVKFEWLWFGTIPKSKRDLFRATIAAAGFGPVHWACDKKRFCWHLPENHAGWSKNGPKTDAEITARYGCKVA